jgi:hypothetical protein
MKLIQTFMWSNYTFQTINTLPMISLLLFDLSCINICNNVNIVFCKWLCSIIFRMYLSVLLFIWYIPIPVNRENYSHNVNHHLVEIISLFLNVFNDKEVRMLLVVDDHSGDQRSQLIFLLDLILISVITIHVMISQ